MTKSLQEAKKVINKRKMTKIVTPQKLMDVSSQLNSSLQEALNTIAYLKSGGAGYSAFSKTSKVLTGKYT